MIDYRHHNPAPSPVRGMGESEPVAAKGDGSERTGSGKGESSGETGAAVSTLLALALKTYISR